MLNLDNLDPDWKLATLHAKASAIGYAIPAKNNVASTVLCPCCFQVVYKDPVPICVNSKQLQFLGFGFPLFYSFLKNCMILVIILIGSYNAISLKKAYDSNYNFCHVDPDTAHHRLLASTAKTPCTSFLIDLARLDSSVNEEEEILRIASFVVQLLFLVYMRDHITKLEKYYDERNTSFADYAVMMKNVPRQGDIQRKLRDFFGKCFSSPFEIKQITLLPEYPDIEQLQQNRLQIINELRQAYQRQQFSEDDIRNQGNLTKIDQAIEEEVQNSRLLAQRDAMECEKVILVFNTDQIKSQVLDMFDQIQDSIKGQFFGIGAEDITIKEAPEPKEILWKNVNVDKDKKFALYLTSWGLSTLLLLIITIIFYFVLEQKTLNLLRATEQLAINHSEYQDVYNGAVALVFIMLLFIIIFNKLIMSTLFYKFTEMERHETRSKFQFSFGLKYLLGLFFTTALMTLAVQAIRFNNYYAHPYGVIEEQTIMFILNAFFTPLFWLFNPFSVAKSIKRKLNYGKRSLTQEQANYLMEPSHYDMGKRYAEVIETMWFTFLYATLIPVGAFISLVGIFIYYWVDKYILLRKSALRGEVSGKLVITGMKLLDATLFLKPAGQLMFDIQVRQKTGLASSITMMLIGLLYLILPIGKLINIINPEMFNLEQKTYEQVKQNFKHTYHTEHPIYKRIIAEKVKRKLSRRGHSFDYTAGTNQNLNQNMEDTLSKMKMSANLGDLGENPSLKRLK